MILLAKLSWHPGLISLGKSIDDRSFGDLSSGPRLPGELLRKVIGFTVRLAGANAIELEDPFSLPYINEEYPEVDPGLFTDRKNLSLVNSSWRAIVQEISAEYLVIYSGDQLKALVKKFEAAKQVASRQAKRAHSTSHRQKWIGERTLRIDFKILGFYSIEHIVRLLQCVPNLQTYVNKNGPPGPPEEFTPVEVINALMIHNSHSLRRVEWSGAGEAPRYQEIVKLCNRLPHLTTLRLVAVHSYPINKAMPPPLLVLPKLKTLSLGLIPETDKNRPQYAITWDVFLHFLCLSPLVQIPSLERFDCDIFPHRTMRFFQLHGHKLRTLRTTPWSTENVHSETLSLCPNLHTLVITQGIEGMSFPQFHPSLAKICIFPYVDVTVGVPQKVFDSAVMGPLDGLLKSLETMVAPHLVELRIQNIGAYVNLFEYSTWLRFWWIRWNIRGVHFCDKSGKSYKDIHDPNEWLLNSVRC
ncbi:hypothetical protein CPB84DRAFT_1772076 [Gymnopilus junonius]|uniref:Uncharacterized protein n=1 Tax=Gymnopilus junonius TaxID=109634 RepID=A0A9P5TPP6_GYMJU|nr:hypothetical protein CPB84DRAFT_1772076 [Gymnopilus junonius]